MPVCTSCTVVIVPKSGRSVHNTGASRYAAADASSLLIILTPLCTLTGTIPSKHHADARAGAYLPPLPPLAIPARLPTTRPTDAGQGLRRLGELPDRVGTTRGSDAEQHATERVERQRAGGRLDGGLEAAEYGTTAEGSWTAEGDEPAGTRRDEADLDCFLHYARFPFDVGQIVAHVRRDAVHELFPGYATSCRGQFIPTHPQPFLSFILLIWLSPSHVRTLSRLYLFPALLPFVLPNQLYLLPFVITYDFKTLVSQYTERLYAKYQPNSMHYQRNLAPMIP